jgi:hypothetical protein
VAQMETGMTATASSMSQMETESSMYCHHGSNGDWHDWEQHVSNGN